MIIKKLPAELNIHALPGVNVMHDTNTTSVVVSAVRLARGVDVEVHSSKTHLEVRSSQDQDTFNAVVRNSHNGGWEVSESFLTDWETFVDAHDHQH